MMRSSIVSSIAARKFGLYSITAFGFDITYIAMHTREKPYVIEVQRPD